MTRIATLTTGISFVLLGSLILGWNAIANFLGLPAPALWRLWPLFWKVWFWFSIAVGMAVMFAVLILL